MQHTQKIKKLSIQQCIDRWNAFERRRDYNLKETNDCYLTVLDRESILDKLVQCLESHGGILVKIKSEMDEHIG